MKKSTMPLVRRYGGALVALVALSGIILTGQEPARSFVAATGVFGEPEGATLFVSLRDEPLVAGEIGRIDVRVRTDVPINAAGATVSFDPDALDVLAISKIDSFFDLWTEETTIREQAGEIHFSGGTTRKDGLRGTGTMLTLAVRAKRAGETTVSFTGGQALASDGRGTEVLRDTEPLTFTIQPRPENASESAPRSADFNGDGHVSAADLSILALKLFASYEERYDLDRNGAIDPGDLSVFFPQMER